MSGSNRLNAGVDIQLGNARLTLQSGWMRTIFIIVFSSLYVIRDLAGVYFPDILFTALCGIAFLLLDYGAALGVYMFTFSLTVPMNEIMIVYVLAFAIKQLSVGGIRFHKGMFTITVALLVLQMVDMSLFSRSNIATMIYDYITKMLYIVIPLLWYMLDASPTACRHALVCYIWGCLLGATVVMVLTANEIGWGELLTGNQYQRLGVTVNENNTGMQSTYNANQLGGMMAISVSIALTLMEKRKLSKIFGLTICCFAIGIVAMTKSRTGLLCTTGAIVLYIAYIVICKKRFMRGLLFAAAILLVVGVLLYAEPELFNGILSRFSDQEDLSNGRSDLFVLYMEAWLSNPWSLLFGYGIKSFQHVVSIGVVPHNAITDILICWGLTGAVLIIAIWISFYRLATRHMQKVDCLLASIPVVVALVMVMAGQYLTTGFPHMRMCFLLLSMSAISNECT